VASIDEAIALRRARIKTPVLVLGSVLPEEISAALNYGITLTLCSETIAREIQRRVRRQKQKLKVHIKVDTGMGRIGVWHEEAFEFVNRLRRYGNILLEGIYTHFSVAGKDRFFTQFQLNAFNSLLDKLNAAGINFLYRHAANSIAIVKLKESHFNLVRPGLVLYGMYPKKGFESLLKLKPVLSLKTRVVYLKRISAGRSVSYGRTFIAQRPTLIATLPIGYGDGYERILSNRAKVIIRGKRAPIVGIVTMDQTMVDVGRIKHVRIGDEAVLIGRQGRESMTAEEIAHVSHTIPYEIVCSIAKRVPRIYKG
jgi:alanine racemase